MAHELAFFTDGRARMAYVGSTPWHGLGQELTPNAPLEVWAKEAGMDFEIAGAPVTFTTKAGKTYAQGSKQVLYRMDTDDALGVVGNKYKVVQPIQILEFFRNLVADQGMQLETAGVLFNGAKYWAMARTGNEARIKGQDVIKQYLMLVTACDGSLKTTAKMIETRVVCNNTLQMAVGESNGEIKVSHSSSFDAFKIQSDLGIYDGIWKDHVEQVRAMADRKLTVEEAARFVVALVGDSERPIEENRSIPAVGKVLSLYGGFGKGSEFKAANGTAWGAVNAFSEYIDWHIGKNQDRRLESAWLYKGSNEKQRAFDLGLKLAA